MEEEDCPAVGSPWMSERPSIEEDDEQVDIEPETVDLDNFRKEWEKELSQNKNKSGNSSRSKENVAFKLVSKSTPGCDVEREEEARQLFSHAVGLEKGGDFYEACRYYKRAFQLVPDIERRVSIDVYPQQQQQHPQQQQQQAKEEEDKENTCPEEDEDLCLDLRSKFINQIEENGWVWLIKDVQGLDRNKLHLGDFPEEVLKYIVRWVVSNDVDVRSLDNLSNVSTGFYVICRSEVLWRDICLRIWGNELRRPSEFPSYRHMYFNRSHVNFDGVYISKVTYVRSGERSWQDQNYRPWHIIEYYRYFRFLPDKTVLFLTTSEPPSAAVQSLRDPNPKSPTKILQGRYNLDGQTITMLCTTVKKPRMVMNYSMEFTIGSAKSSKFNCVLKWKNYAVSFSNYDQRLQVESNNQSHFELEPNKFPPLIFSRVKSFNRFSENVL